MLSTQGLDVSSRALTRRGCLKSSTDAGTIGPCLTISPAGDRAVVDAALALASTAVDIATPGAVDRLREEFASPIPDSSLRLSS